jgi:hypothetical protein
MLIEIHMIQNHSPANMNRDDLGAPKTCLFGGVSRARISSQCLKRSIRAPRNPHDIHNRGAGIFAEAMAAHLGCRTKFFPWLVKKELSGSQIPEADHKQIVLAAKRIAQSKEKEEKGVQASAKADRRPKTPQLIHLGPGHAKYFVDKLTELRGSSEDRYRYFLNPVVGFQEMVRSHLSGSDLNDRDKERERAVRASFLIAKFRMKELLRPAEGETEQAEPELEDEPPGSGHAELIAERLATLYTSDKRHFTEVTKQATEAEKRQIKEDAPDKPKGMDQFMDALKSANRYDAVDIALFGRMTTSDAFEDVEAAMQVAHAVSTHQVVNETDYCTAVDDLGKTGGGAGHVFEGIYNSACFYKYFSLDWDQLVLNLTGPKPDAEKDAAAYNKWADELKPAAEKLAAAALGHFIRAAALTTPSGKQNSFASHCDPCGILIEIKKTKIPTSYGNAFAEPVKRIGEVQDDTADEQSIEGRSVACLADHVHALRNSYGADSTLLWYSPKLWRFPLRYWPREKDGKKQPSAELVANRSFDILGGEEGKPQGLVEAVVKEIGFDWSEVRNLGKATEA